MAGRESEHRTCAALLGAVGGEKASDERHESENRCFLALNSAEELPRGANKFRRISVGGREQNQS